MKNEFSVFTLKNECENQNYIGKIPYIALNLSENCLPIFINDCK